MKKRCLYFIVMLFLALSMTGCGNITVFEHGFSETVEMYGLVSVLILSISTGLFFVSIIVFMLAFVMQHVKKEPVWKTVKTISLISLIVSVIVIIILGLNVFGG